MHAIKSTVSMLAAAALLATGCATAPSESSRETLAAAQASAASRTLPRWQTEAGANAAIHARNPSAAGMPPQTVVAPPRPAAANPAAPPVGQTASSLQARGTVPPGSALTNESGKPTPSLQDVIAEIESLGSVNPDVQKRLLEELRQCDPALWPLLTQQIRATLAYQQQQHERAATPAENAPPRQAAEQRPAIAEQSPAIAEQSPAIAEQRPAIAEQRPAIAEQRPALAEERPAPADHQPGGNGPPPPGAASGASAQVAATPPAAPGPLPEQSSTKEIAAAASPAAAVGAIQKVSYELPVAASDWNAKLAEAIQGLEAQTRAASQDADPVSMHARLRMLYLVAGRRDAALQPIPGAAAPQQEYWSKQLYALSTYLDSQRIADPGRRAAEAVSHLSHAAASLGELGPLVVKNLTFCTEVSSYGVYKRLEHNEFKPGQQALLYAEVEHFKIEETRDGFHTALQSSYQILDAQGRRVAHDDFALTEEHCQNRRRDYFVRYFLTLPAQIYEGQYTLELTVEDTLGRKLGQSTVQFSVASKPKSHP